MDNTDVWAWQDSAGTISIITAWNGVTYASGGPNYRKWTPKDQGVYEIHVDTNGDGRRGPSPTSSSSRTHDNGAEDVPARHLARGATAGSRGPSGPDAEVSSRLTA